MNQPEKSEEVKDVSKEFTEYENRKLHKDEAKRMYSKAHAIAVAHPAPVEKYIFHLPRAGQREVLVTNMVGTPVVYFTNTRDLRFHFQGYSKVMAKAKIIDGVFTILSWHHGRIK